MVHEDDKFPDKYLLYSPKKAQTGLAKAAWLLGIVLMTRPSAPRPSDITSAPVLSLRLNHTLDRHHL